jgi:hypothetical protein
MRILVLLIAVFAECVVSGIPASAQEEFCQKQAYILMRCPMCAERVPAQTCYNSTTGGVCCENLGEEVPCSSGCGSVMQSTVYGFCDGHHPCTLGLAEAIADPALQEFASQIRVPSCDGSFIALADAKLVLSASE